MPTLPTPYRHSDTSTTSLPSRTSLSPAAPPHYHHPHHRLPPLRMNSRSPAVRGHLFEEIPRNRQHPRPITQSRIGGGSSQGHVQRSSAPLSQTPPNPSQNCTPPCVSFPGIRHLTTDSWMKKTWINRTASTTNAMPVNSNHWRGHKRPY
ncbi:hypothetical protein GWK47_053794 [Chionoecetes opilio]|uniref:Uncharacterized protein n=1 Tax=Chionoecetes opilio TaxID=41210 RepID=A0A8J4Y548_CHIOP|nr:hypothetical protein GWK47_053794 [Chionoecetes opilio]